MLGYFFWFLVSFLTFFIWLKYCVIQSKMTKSYKKCQKRMKNKIRLLFIMKYWVRWKLSNLFLFKNIIRNLKLSWDKKLIKIWTYGRWFKSKRNLGWKMRKVVWVMGLILKLLRDILLANRLFLELGLCFVQYKIKMIRKNDKRPNLLVIYIKF